MGFTLHAFTHLDLLRLGRLLAFSLVYCALGAALINQGHIHNFFHDPSFLVLKGFVRGKKFRHARSWGKGEAPIRHDKEASWLVEIPGCFLRHILLP